MRQRRTLEMSVSAHVQTSRKSKMEKWVQSKEYIGGRGFPRLSSVLDSCHTEALSQVALAEFPVPQWPPQTQTIIFRQQHHCSPSCSSETPMNNVRLFSFPRFSHPRASSCTRVPHICLLLLLSISFCSSQRPLLPQGPAETLLLCEAFPDSTISTLNLLRLHSVPLPCFPENQTSLENKP